MYLYIWVEKDQCQFINNNNNNKIYFTNIFFHSIKALHMEMYTVAAYILGR